jgi:hypothetical protein
VRLAGAIPSRSGKAVVSEATRSVGTRSSELALVRPWTRELGSTKAQAKVSGGANGAMYMGRLAEYDLRGTSLD